MNRLFLSAVLLSTVALAPACKRSPAQMEACRNNADCASLDPTAPYCVDGACAACVADAHCDAGEACVDLTCQAIPGWCANDDACQGSFVCRDNRCEPQCITSADCGNGQSCDAGVCIDAECVADNDCAPGFRCENRACVDVTACSIDNLDPVYFDFDQAVLSREAVATIDQQWTCLADPDQELVLSGHADERGTSEYNLALGERRARSVKRYLTDRGVEGSMLSIVSYGELRPAARGTTESAYRQNRRVEFDPTTRAASR